LYGAQYLHAPIPYVTPVLDCKIVNYTLNGTPEEYRRKVYGDADVEVSPVKLLGPQKAWDIRDTYEHLWALYHDLVTPMADIKYHEVQEIMAREDWARVYSSIPAPAICAAPSWHHFESVRIWAVGAVETLGAFAPREMEDAGAIVCDGTSERRWYRSSNVFGFTTVEWPYVNHPGAENDDVKAVAVRKPIRHGCICYQRPMFRRIGRYGAWRKGVLVHEVFTEVTDDLERGVLWGL